MPLARETAPHVTKIKGIAPNTSSQTALVNGIEHHQKCLTPNSASLSDITTLELVSEEEASFL